MKIVMINVVCGIRSTGRICAELAEELEKQGHEVKIAYGREEVPKMHQKYAIRIGNNTSVRLDALKSRFLDNAGFNSKGATRKFLEWLEEYNPDVIHIHNLHGYYINVELLFDYLKKINKKVIWTLHDCWAFAGHSALCDGVGCEKWKRGCNNCPQMNEYPRAWVDKSSLNWRKKKQTFTCVPNMTIVTPSKWLASKVKESFLGNYDIKVIPNGIDVGVFNKNDGSDENQLRHRFDLMDKIIILGAATTWNELKGFRDFINLAEMLGDKYRIVLVGLSDNQIKIIPDNIIGIKRTSSQFEMADWYRTADVFVNLTYCDTYPTVNIEAVSCGVPVITYDTGGSPEAMLGFGRVVEKGNIEAVEEVLINNDYQRNEIISEIDMNELDKAKCIQNYMVLYDF